MASAEEVKTMTGDATENEGMVKLISIVNKLREAFSVMHDHSSIDLPCIAVVGSQSAGKSSVLENIVGHSFLPRGSGIVTRCPCEIRMHNTKGEEYGVFQSSDTPDRRYYDFNQVRDKIESETHRVAGARGLTTTPILLDIYSPNVLDLTLIDLPGAVRTVGEGQDPDIIRKIESMILQYISQPNCIILAVSAANADLAVSDAIALSRKVDPKGERTLGVLTKLDLMDEGTDARRIITGEDENAPKLKLGYIGVVNRSQRDINEARTINDARSKEAEYFAKHPAYRSLFSRMGTTHLVNCCSQQLVQAIQRELPTISRKLGELIARKKEELRGLPETSPETMRSTLTEIIHDFVSKFNALIDGLKRSSGGEQFGMELVGGARIEALFSTVFRNEILNMSVFRGPESDVDRIRVMIKNTKGLGGGLFMDNAALDKLISMQVHRVQDPSMRCARMVFDEMSMLQGLAIDQVVMLQAFPKARLELIQVVNRVLARQLERTVDQLTTFVEMNMSRINYDHPDFDSVRVMHEVEVRRYGTDENEEEQRLVLKAHAGADLTQEEKAKVRGIMARRQQAAKDAELAQRRGAAALAADGPRPSSVPPPPPSSSGMRRSTSLNNKVDGELHAFLSTINPKEKTQVEQVIALTEAYFDLMKKTVVDQVPKFIQLLLVEHSQREVARDVMMLVSDARVEELMSPSEDVKIRREEVQAALSKLLEANEMLYEVSRAASSGL